MNLLVFLMMAMGAVGAFSEVHAQLPSHGPPGEEARWRPTVVLTERGAFVSDGAGTYAAGCEAHAPGEATGSSTVSSSVKRSRFGILLTLFFGICTSNLQMNSMMLWKSFSSMFFEDF